MPRVAQILRRGHGIALREAPTEATFYKMTHGTPDPLAPVDAPTLAATEIVRVVSSNEMVDSDSPDTQPNSVEILTVRIGQLTWTPSEADRVAVGGKVFAIAKVDNVQGALLKVRLAGEAGVPTAGADVTPPVVTSLVLTTGVEAFTYTTTFGEAAKHRLRYRKPPNVGSYTTISYSGTFETSTGGSVTSLDAGTYQVQVQAKDSSDNESDWYDGGTVVVTGIPS